MLSAAHVLAMDAKNLLDVVDAIRIQYPHVDSHILRRREEDGAVAAAAVATRGSDSNSSSNASSLEKQQQQQQQQLFRISNSDAER